jgi:predicted phosphohydrolase
MTIWALSDPHLSFGVENKSMELFGPLWAHHPEKIAEGWRTRVGKEDLVLVPGDISWAMDLEEAKKDLDWLDALPGKKLILKGNHDFWWSSSKKLEVALPNSITYLHNSAFCWNGCTIGGARLWDTDEYSFQELVDYAPSATTAPAAFATSREEDEKIYRRELQRLKRSLEQLDPRAKYKIAITHYPPIGPAGLPSRASALLEDFGISICVFGHLHSLKATALPLTLMVRGIHYILASCDAINFTPIKILET